MVRINLERKLFPRLRVTGSPELVYLRHTERHPTNEHGNDSVFHRAVEPDSLGLTRIGLNGSG